MPSRINSTTTSPGGLISTGDSDNSLLIQTGDTTAITISSTQQVTLTNPLPVGSGGTGGTTGLTALNASNLTSGTVPDARFPATLPAASGAALTSLNASAISSGTVGTARLASGTANNTTYLRGDQTWATVQGGPNPLHGDQVFTSSGTFNVPTGVTTVKVTVIGAGGSGGNGSGDFQGGGGGAGGYVVDYVAVTSGGTATVTVGTNGGTRTSSFAGTTTLTASGGANGGNSDGSNTGLTGVNAGFTLFGQTAYSSAVRITTAGNIQDVATAQPSDRQTAGQCHQTYFGAGGHVKGSVTTYTNGVGYGAGAGGGGTPNAGFNSTGGIGRDGLVIVEW